MNARTLLETIEARGGVASVKRRSDGAAVLNVAPRSCCADLLPDLQKFKPALLELLTGADAPSQPDALESARLRLNRLEAHLGTAGACRAIYAAARHIEARNPDFFRRLRRESRHELAICAALLDAGELLE